MTNDETGLHPDVMRMIGDVLSRHPEIDRTLLFGSRANGTFRANSDIDLAVSGITDAKKLEDIKMTLNELPLPYKFDVVATDLTKSTLLLNRIVREGIGIYEKKL